MCRFFQALKSDCIKTLIHRCDLLCVDLLQSEEEQGASGRTRDVIITRCCCCATNVDCFVDQKIVYETPQRVFTLVPNTQLFVSDYLFADETAKDSRNRLRELLDILVDPNEVVTDAEPKPRKHMNQITYAACCMFYLKRLNCCVVFSGS